MKAIYIITWGLERPEACQTMADAAVLVLDKITDGGYYESRLTAERIEAILEETFEGDPEDYAIFEGYDGEKIRVYELKPYEALELWG